MEEPSPSVLHARGERAVHLGDGTAVEGRDGVACLGGLAGDRCPGLVVEGALPGLEAHALRRNHRLAPASRISEGRVTFENTPVAPLAAQEIHERGKTSLCRLFELCLHRLQVSPEIVVHYVQAILGENCCTGEVPELVGVEVVRRLVAPVNTGVPQRTVLELRQAARVSQQILDFPPLRRSNVPVLYAQKPCWFASESSQGSHLGR